MQLVSARLDDRNTLANPKAIVPKSGDVKLDGSVVKFELPAYSAGVVVVK
jgi:hypothetical protein